MKNYVLIIMTFVFMASGTAFGQKSKEVKEIQILTSAICGDCKERIEHHMKFEKGVREAKLDLETKMLTVSFIEDKISEDDIRQAVSKIGYRADNVPADQKAVTKLPGCCQPKPKVGGCCSGAAGAGCSKDTKKEVQ